MWPCAQFRYQVWTTYSAQRLLNVAAFLRLIPEEKLPLRKLFLLRLGTKHRFKRVRVVASVPCFGAHRHWRGRKVLHLFQMEVHPFGQHGQFSHVSLMTAGMTAYEIRYNLLLEIFLTVDSVEDALELLKLTERRFAHKS